MRRNRLKNIQDLFIFGAGSSFALTCQKDGKAGPYTAPMDASLNAAICDLKSRKKWVARITRRIQEEYIGPKTFRETGMEESVIRRLSDY